MGHQQVNEGQNICVPLMSYEAYLYGVLPFGNLCLHGWQARNHRLEYSRFYGLFLLVSIWTTPSAR